MDKIIFFGNGMLADAALEVLQNKCEVMFHARTREDLARAVEIKREHPEAHGVLASFGVMIREPVLEAFSPEGILNIHPSLLPKYRGASPIESAILAGDNEFGVSVMRLVKAMDAGPVYWQKVLTAAEIKAESSPSGGKEAILPEKSAIYRALATAGTEWLVRNLKNLPEPKAQDEEKATFARKFSKADGLLTPEVDTAEQTYRKIVAFQGFPKPKYMFYGISCIILEAHLEDVGDTAVTEESRLQESPMNVKGISSEHISAKKSLMIPCVDGRAVIVDRLQPEGRKPMDAKSFLNGHKKK